MKLTITVKVSEVLDWLEERGEDVAEDATLESVKVHYNYDEVDFELGPEEDEEEAQ